MPDRLHEVVGVIHIHSNYSDGSKPIEEIARIGETAGLDYLMFSDHNSLKALRDGHEKFYGKIAAIIGYEIEDVNEENHYLAFGLDKELPPGLSPKEYVSNVHSAGALGIIAHPDEIRSAAFQYPAYPWNDWEVHEFDAIEIWNHMSAWLESIKKFNALKMIFHPRRDLRGPTDRVLKKWDELSSTRKVAGIGSADVHAHIYRRGPIRLTVFPYKVQFRSIRTHLLLENSLGDDIAQAKMQIFDAIRSCRIFVSNFRWGDARGFRFYADNGKERAEIGDQIKFSDDLFFEIQAPSKAEIRVIKGGQLTAILTGDSLRVPVRSPGLYRLELLKRDKGWIYTNHIRVI